MRKQNRKLHKWIGIISSIFILIISFTAIFLNHQSEILRVILPNKQNQSFVPAKIIALATDPFAANHLVASDNQALFQSFDGGKNWEELKLFIPGEKINNIAFDPSNKGKFYVAKKEAGIYVTDDGGEIWDSTELPFYAPEGEYIEKLSVGKDGNLTIKTKFALYNGNPEQGKWQTVNFNQSEKEKLIDLSGLIYELHTGKFFGEYGVYFYDLFSIFLVFLACSGLVLAIRPKRKKEVLNIRTKENPEPALK